MKYFLDLLETVKKNGIYYPDGVRDRPLAKSALDNNFWSIIEQNEVFVFHQTKDQGHLPDLEKIHDPSSAYPNIDAPFKVFSFELLGSPLTRLAGADINCVVVWEISPKKYCYYALFQIGNTLKVMTTNTLGNLTNYMLKCLEGGKDGIESTRRKIKIGSGSTKRFMTIRRVIHIGTTKKLTEYIQDSGSKIDFTHRFSVRGHWRELNEKNSKTLIGKDRVGNYCVQGQTWVNDSIKGSEDKPLIRKTRIKTDDNKELKWTEKP
jgi:hypothetical protein